MDELRKAEPDIADTPCPKCGHLRRYHFMSVPACAPPGEDEHYCWDAPEPDPVTSFFRDLADQTIDQYGPALRRLAAR